MNRNLKLHATADILPRHLPDYECGFSETTHAHYATEGREKGSNKVLQTSKELCQAVSDSCIRSKDGKLAHQEGASVTAEIG
jgi:hypothetical protein